MTQVLGTRVTDLLGIRHPILMGGLQGLGRAPLAAAVCAAGGLGVITAGCFPDADGLDAEIADLRAVTDRPFGVNISIGSRRSMRPFLETALRREVPVVITSGNDPSQFVPDLRAAGVTWIHVAPALRYARKAVDLGAQAIVLVGFEAGGHPGLDDVALSVLVRLAVRELSVPIIAAGGISDGASLVAALSWGAEAVQMGTRFVMTRECDLHPAVTARLLTADERSTVIIERSLRKARRVLHTAQASEVLRLEELGADFAQLRHIIGGESYLRTIIDGDLDAGVLSTGQNIGLIDETPSAGEVVRRIMDEAMVAIDRLAGMRIAPFTTSDRGVTFTDKESNETRAEEPSSV